MSDGEGAQEENKFGEFVAPKQASAVRKGGHVMLKDHPCKIQELSTSKTGKHGHAKVKMVGICVLTDKKYQELYSASHNCYEPIVNKLELQVTDINADGQITCIDEKFEEVVCQLPKDGDLGEQIRAKHKECSDKGKDMQISILRAPDITGMVERVVGFKEMTE